MSQILDGADGKERERRKALADELLALSQTASTETALFHQAAAAKYGLGITDMKTLNTLLQEGPMTAGQLAKRLSLTTGAITNVVDRLERRNLVIRAPDSKDRRKVIIMVNQQTLDAGENVYSSIGEAFYALFGTYTTEELEFLARYFQTSIELTRQEIAKLANRDV